MTQENALQVREKHEVAQEGTRPGPVFRPDVDIFQRKDGYTVLADLPGATDDSVQVRLEDGVLSIDAQLATLPEGGWTPLHQEYRVGGFRREFRISKDIDAERVSATLRDGVLELQLPKTAERQPRAIEVRAG